MPSATTLFSLDATRLEDSEARLGHLNLPDRNTIDTPNFLAVTSRGTVPHITQDVFAAETPIKGIYAGLEDYVEQLPKTPPVYSFPCKAGDSPLGRFIALKNDSLLVLGPRRMPALSPPESNTWTSMAVSTSKGFRQLEISHYISAVEKLRPDIAVGPVDYELGEGRAKPGMRRQDKMDERTLEWVRGMVAKKTDQSKHQIWAPILPIEPGVQRSYLEYLREEPDHFCGLALYETESVAAIPSSLQYLPRMSFSELKTPHALLHAVDLGIDIFALSFITKITDAGVAFTFDFNRRASSGSKEPLGLDLWSEELASDTTSIKNGCHCYACKTHHRAYIRHLLDAKEMLAWALLQIHNHHQVDRFFADIRQSIGRGTFVQDMKNFSQAFEEDFPVGSGEGPRLRGYQIRIAQPGPPKANLPARRKLDKADLEAIEVARATKQKEKLDDEAQRVGEASEAGLFAPDLYLNADQLEDKGFAEREL